MLPQRAAEQQQQQQPAHLTDFIDIPDPCLVSSFCFCAVRDKYDSDVITDITEVRTWLD